MLEGPAVYSPVKPAVFPHYLIWMLRNKWTHSLQL